MPCIHTYIHVRVSRHRLSTHQPASQHSPPPPTLSPSQTNTNPRNNKQVPKAVHFETPNPLIPWERLPFIIPRATMPLAEELSDDPNATVGTSPRLESFIKSPIQPLPPTDQLTSASS